MGLLYMHFRDNTGLGVLVTVELKCFRGNACLGRQLPQIRNTELFEALSVITAA
jgi:hypothetical protein